MQRVRIARMIDEAMLHRLLAVEFAQGARLEIVLGNAARLRIARSLDPAVLRLLVKLVGAGARLELVYASEPTKDDVTP